MRPIAILLLLGCSLADSLLLNSNFNTFFGDTAYGLGNGEAFCNVLAMENRDENCTIVRVDLAVVGTGPSEGYDAYLESLVDAFPNTQVLIIENITAYTLPLSLLRLEKVKKIRFKGSREKLGEERFIIPKEFSRFGNRMMVSLGHFQGASYDNVHYLGLENCIIDQGFSVPNVVLLQQVYTFEGGYVCNEENSKEVIPAFLEDATKIQILIVMAPCQVSHFPPRLVYEKCNPHPAFRFNKLRLLGVTGHSCTLPETIWSMPRLQHLQVQMNAVDFTGATFPLPGVLQTVTMVVVESELPSLFYESFKSLQKLALFPKRESFRLSPAVASLENLSELTIESLDTITNPILRGMENTGLTPGLIKFVCSVPMNGVFPTWLRNLTTLKILHLNTGNFTGQIPEWITELANLEDLSLFGDLHSHKWSQVLGITSRGRSGPGLEGKIEMLFGLRKLQSLVVNDNQFTGEIPVLNSELESIRLANNRFKGTFTLNPRFLHVDLSGNQFSKLKINGMGTVGDEFKDNPNTMRTLKLGGNPWDCHCDLLYYMQEMAKPQYGITRVDRDETRCGSVNEYEGMRVDKLKYIESEPCFSPHDIQVSNLDPNTVAISWKHNKDGTKASNLADVMGGEVDIDKAGCFPCEQLDYLQAGHSDGTLMWYSVQVRDGSNQRLVSLACCSPGHNFQERLVLSFLEPAHSYDVRVSAIHGEPYEISKNDRLRLVAGRSNLVQYRGPFSAPRRFETAEAEPNHPTRVHAVDVGRLDFTLSWKSPTPFRGKIILYQVRETGSKFLPRNISGNLTVHVVDQLEPGGLYNVQIRAYTEYGPSPWTQPISVQTSPPCKLGSQVDSLDQNKCILCARGWFRASNMAWCNPCPSTHPVTKHRGADSADLCIAEKGMFMLEDRTPLSCEKQFGPAVNCSTPGVFVRNLTINPGYWRIRDTSIQVRKCPHEEFCKATTQSTSPYCRPHHIGPLCEACEPGYAIHQGMAIGCVACTPQDVSSARARFYIWALVFSLLFITLPVGRLIFASRKQNGKSTSSIRNCCCPHKKEELRSLWIKVRMVIGFYQVFFVYTNAMNMFRTRDEVEMDDSKVSLALFDYSVFLHWFDVSCYLDLRYFQYLLIFTVVPLVVLACLMVTCAVLKSWSKYDPKLLAQELLWTVLSICFLIYPGVSAKIIEAFLWESFPRYPGDPDPYRTHRSDVTKVYRGNTGWDVFTIIMAFVYPFGVFVLFAWAIRLYRARGAGCRDKETKSCVNSKSVGFLCDQYKAKYNWFELFDLFRKLAQTSLFLILNQITPNGSTRIFTAASTLFCISFAWARPYRSRENNVLGSISLFLLVLMGVTSVNEGGETWQVRALSITIAVVEALIFLTVLLYERFDWGCFDINVAKLTPDQRQHPKTMDPSFCISEIVFETEPDGIIREETVEVCNL